MQTRRNRTEHAELYGLVFWREFFACVRARTRVCVCVSAHMSKGEQGCMERACLVVVD